MYLSKSINFPLLHRLTRSHQSALALAFLATAARLFLGAQREILAEEYDSHSYVVQSLAWYWHGGDASHPPGFPLFVAVCRSMHLPLRLAFELCLFASVAYLAYEVHRATRQTWGAVAGFVLSLLCPTVLLTLDFVVSDNLVTIGVVAAIGLLLGAVQSRSSRGRWSRATGAAIIIAVLCVSRPEQPLYFGTLVLVGIIVAQWSRRRSDNWKLILGHSLRVALVPLLVCQLTVALVSAANQLVFGFYGIAAINSRSYGRFYKDLLSIAEDGDKLRYFSVDRRVREQAYRVSPTFASFRTAFEGPITYFEWAKSGYGAYDLMNGWFPWQVLRIFPGPYRKQQEILDRIASELESAFRTGELVRRAVVISPLDPRWSLWVPHYPEGLLRAFKLSSVPEETIFPLRPQTENSTIAHDFDRATLRRSKLAGWDAHPPSRLAHLLDRLMFWWQKLLCFRLFGVATLGLGLAIACWGLWSKGRPLSGVLAYGILGSFIVVRCLFYGLVETAGWHIEARYLLPNAIPVIFFVCLSVSQLVSSRSTPIEQTH
jgi:hypothetical protein